MWVYQPQILLPEKAAPPEHPVHTISCPVQLPEKSPEPSAQEAVEQAAAPKPPQPVRRSGRKRRQPTRDCWMLAAAFLLGTAAAGWIQAMCDAQQLELLAYYLKVWQDLFAVPDFHGAARLFCAEYAALTVAATLLLWLGLSALGPALIFLFSMVYGLGSGLLFSRVFSGTGWTATVLLLLLTAVPGACAAACLCVFGASALQVSGRIRAYSFLHQGGHAVCGARTLLGQYILTLVALLPLCGAATAAAYLYGHF